MSQSMISLNSLFQPSLQFNLRRAAKARIDRMCTPKMRRKDLEAPDYVKTEWKNNGNKNLMADILQRVNWDKDCKLYLVESWNVSWCQNRCFEHCLHWMFTGRMRSATRFSSLSKKEDLPTHHWWGLVQRGGSQRAGLEPVQFSNCTSIMLAFAHMNPKLKITNWK